MTEVTQADRDAAIDLDERHIIQVWNIDATAKAFAEHRARATEAQAAEIERIGQRILMWLGAYRDGLSADAIAELQHIARAALGETLHVSETRKENGETFT